MHTLEHVVDRSAREFDADIIAFAKRGQPFVDARFRSPIRIKTADPKDESSATTFAALEVGNLMAQSDRFQKQRGEGSAFASDERAALRLSALG
jgi:hypothetical protein